MSIFNREKPIENSIKKRQPKKPIFIALDVLIIIIAVVGLYLVFKPMYDHWKQDQASEKLQNAFETGDGTIVIRPDEYVVPGEDIEYLTDQEGDYDFPPDYDSEIEEEPEEEPEEVVIKAIGRIKIDRIKIDMPVAEGTSKYTLRVAVGHYSPSAPAGDPGNSIYLGHRMYTYGRHFNRLGEVVEGDIVTVESKTHRYTYEVDRISIIDPQDLFAAFNEQTNGDNRLILVTCHPVRIASHRLLVHGRLVDTAPLT